MPNFIELTEGQMAPVKVQLLDDGAVIDRTGWQTPTLVLHDRFNRLVSTTGDVVWVGSSESIVAYYPGANDLRHQRGPYRARFRLLDGATSSGLPAFWPSGFPDSWRVYEQ